jgi:hypothetical protein
VHALLDDVHPDAIGLALHDRDHFARASEQVELSDQAGQPFDVLHDQSGFTALEMADRMSIPVVHTIHGPFDSIDPVRCRASAADPRPPRRPQPPSDRTLMKVRS